MPQTKIIVLDDDPTGSQTVHGCLLLTRWDTATLKDALADAAPLFFILTNTRGADSGRAADITRTVCRNLRSALAGQDIRPIFVSRSDSTLRGHYPVETDVLAEELGPFDAHFLVPAFFEGGRFTRASVHYLKTDGGDIPVHQTEFARDSVFGYRHSYLPDYVEEKTGGRVKAGDVVRLQLEDIRHGVLEKLLALQDNVCVAVDAENQNDLDRFVADLLRAVNQGKHFMLRSAASLLTSLAQLPVQPIPAEHMGQLVRAGATGAVIVGSHVPKSTRQLEALLKQPDILPIEIDVMRLPGDRASLLQELLAEVGFAHRRGQTPAVYTSRTERVFRDSVTRLAFGEEISAFLMDVVRGLPPTIGFLISKGGITSNDVLSTGLYLRMARLLGQIFPGVSVVSCPHDHPRYPDLPVVIFPGNVGDDRALVTVMNRLRARPADSLPETKA
ncbi:MAG: four-carbon acid sugar kinase family protein [Acidiferrobacterales bacterium]